MALGTSLNFLPEGLRSQELYPKVCGMIDYIVQNFETALEDVKYKYRGPEVVRQEVIEQIIEELGFDYINQLMQTITNFEFNQLLQFLGLINLLKGSRDGLELVLKLLGFDSIIIEWWETAPLGAPATFDLTIVVDSSHVPDLNATIDKVKIFTEHYVYPKINNVELKFSFDFATKNITTAGFVKAKYVGEIMQRI